MLLCPNVLIYPYKDIPRMHSFVSYNPVKEYIELLELLQLKAQAKMIEKVPAKKINEDELYDKKIRNILVSDFNVKNPDVIIKAVNKACKQVEKELGVKVDKSLIYAVIETESTFRNLKPNSVGATGYMQVTPIALKSVQRDLNIKGSLQDPYFNIRVGTYYLYRNIKKYGLDVALVVYNAGYKNLKKNVALSRGRSNSYLSTVKSRSKKYK